MQHRDATFTGAGRQTIHYQSWLPAKVRAVVVIAHGLGEHGGRYADLAARLVAQGYAVYAIDHRGHGRSDGGPSAYVDRLANAVADFDALVERAAREQRGRPVYALGHSMGALIGLSHAIKQRGKLAGLVLSAPAVVPGSASALKAAAVRLLSRFAPRRGVAKLAPEALTRDAAAQADYLADPLVCHAKLPARTIAEILRFDELLPALLPMVDLPLLVLHGTADAVALPAGADLVMRYAGSADKTLKRYEGLRHKLLSELPADRERVIADLIGWLELRLVAAPRRVII